MRQGGLRLAAAHVHSKNQKRKEKRKIYVRPKTHDQINSSPVTPITSRRRATNTSNVSSYSPASVDPGFVETGLVQLSQELKTTNVTRAHSGTEGRQTDILIY